MTNEIAPGKGPIERIALERRLMSPDRIASCHRVRAEIREELGLDYSADFIILERIYTLRRDLRAHYASADSLARFYGTLPQDWWRLPSGTSDAFVEDLLARGRVRPEDRERVRGVQLELVGHGINRHAGELLVDLGLAERPGGPPTAAKVSEAGFLPALAFDRIAVANGFVTEGEVAAARRAQAEIANSVGVRLPLGRILYERGQLRRSEVAAILAAQVRVGRLAPEAATLGVLKLTRAEREELLRRLMPRGATSLADIEGATQKATKLRAHGLSIDAVEILWLERKIPEDEIRPVLEFQESLLSRLGPPSPDVSLAPVASGEEWNLERPEDVPEPDFFFGQCAFVAGAIDRVELSRGLAVLARCREMGLPVTLGQILLEWTGDPRRAEILERARALVEAKTGAPYAVRSLRLSPLERAALDRQLASTSPELGASIERAEAVRTSLAQLGLEMSAGEVLLLQKVLPQEWVESLLSERADRDLRLVGGWRGRDGHDPSTVRSLFERAFSSGQAEHGRVPASLGTLAVQGGFLERADLVQALYTQLRARELGIAKPLGRVLVERGDLSEGELERLVGLQQERIASRVPLPVEDEPSVSDLNDPERILYARLSHILDEEKLRGALRLRARLRDLGLEGSLREIVVARGWVSAEKIGRDFATEDPAAPAARATPAAQRPPLARPGRPAVTIGGQTLDLQLVPLREIPAAADDAPAWSRKLGTAGGVLAVAGILFYMARGALAPATLASPATEVVRTPAASRPDDPRVDPGAFADAMRRMGLAREQGRWALPGEGGRVAPPEPETPIERRREAFAREMTGTGRVLDGVGWLLPAAAERFDLGKENGSRGLVQLRGLWRPADRAVHALAPEAPAGRSIADLEAALLAEAAVTRVGVRFRSRLPAGSPLLLSVADAEAPDRAIHTDLFSQAGTGAVEMEVPSIPLILGPGRYVVRVTDDPLLASARDRAGQPVTSLEAGVSLGTEDQIARARTERQDLHRRVLERLGALAERLASERDPARWARSGLEDLSGLLQAIEDLPIRRDELYSAARILAEEVARAAEGRRPAPEDLARVRSAIERCGDAKEGP